MTHRLQPAMFRPAPAMRRPRLVLPRRPPMGRRPALSRQLRRLVPGLLWRRSLLPLRLRRQRPRARPSLLRLNLLRLVPRRPHRCRSRMRRPPQLQIEALRYKARPWRRPLAESRLFRLSLVRPAPAPP
jgi:hypothetical protein